MNDVITIVVVVAVVYFGWIGWAHYVAKCARSIGRNYNGWLLLGIFASPLIAHIAFLLSVPDDWKRQ